MAEIEVRDLSYVYGVGTPFEISALNHISVVFGSGEVTGLIGHTGCGKSTLVQTLNGLLKPTQGQVLLDGKDIWEDPKKISAVRFRVGLVMQYPEYQLFEETVREDIAFGPKNMGLTPEQIADRVSSAAGSVGITEAVLDKSPFDLSGGQKRRVAIAGILAMDPDVLVLDEPAAGLDPRGRREVLGGLLAYARNTGKTVILVSHSMEDMASCCDRLVVLDHGAVKKCGTPREVFADPELLENCGLSLPQITRVTTRLRRSGMDLPEGIFTVDTAADAIADCLEKNRI